MRLGPCHARLPIGLLPGLLALVLAAPAAQAAPKAPGVQTLKYSFGPLHIAPGQNTIELQANQQKPKVPGYILSFKPDLKRSDGTVPRVDVTHLHHGVWAINFRPIFAAGEEKTTVKYPDGFGYKHDPKDNWIMNHMIHNLTPNPETVSITYEIDFLPASHPSAQAITEVDTQWLDVEQGNLYPVFDAMRGTGGKDGRFTYPDEAKGDPYAGRGTRNTWTADRDATLVQTAGHLHPGGLYTDLKITRDGRTVPLFRSEAKYYEPAGAVSWDVSMGVTPPDWKVAIKKGDVLSVSGTYDTRRASWYESMAIMPVAITNEPAGGIDPFVRAPSGRSVLTHGHLPENDNHGGGQIGLPDMTKTLDGPVAPRQVTIDGFVYNQGDLANTGLRGRPPVIAQGKTLRFVNLDAKNPSGEPMHTVTACKAPCNRSTGIAYPLADAKIPFDSGNLGFGPRGATAAANRDSWSTPRSLPAGTYTYFCRVHPFMRGGFRVKKGAKKT